MTAETPNDNKNMDGFVLNGYSPISAKDLRRGTGERGDEVFDVVDIATGQRETINVVRAPNTPRKARTPRKKEKQQKTPDILPEDSYIESRGGDRKPVRVIARNDLAEITVMADYVYQTDDVVSIIFPSDAPAKISPKKGSTTDLHIEDQKVTVYAPGIHMRDLPYENGIDIVVFFVVPDEEEVYQ